MYRDGQTTIVDGSARRQVTPKLPLEAGRPRVQRLVDALAPVHLELVPPERDEWTLTVDGMVEYECAIALADLTKLGGAERTMDFHCVWGWSRPATRWRGVPVDAVLDLAVVAPGARYAMLRAADSPYASCVPLDDARAGFLATGLDGARLDPVHGGPLRWVQPNHLFAYKGVKWLTSITLQDEYTAGFWEEAVGDVHGRVPEGLLTMLEGRAAA